MIDNQKTTISEVINKKYDHIQKVLKCEWFKSHIEPFDEDLFHDTLYKCIEKMKERECIESEFLNYIFIAFKYNVIRETMYHRNSMKIDTEITYIGDCTQNQSMDYELITNAIREKFGDILCEAFIDWVNGNKITNIESETNIKSIHYKFKKIKEWVKNEYHI